MVQVHRSGSIVSIPRRLSHHVPTVPIIDSQDYERKESVKYFSMEAEEFQLYKVALVDQYQMVERAEWEVSLQTQEYTFIFLSKTFLCKHLFAKIPLNLPFIHSVTRNC